MGIGKLQFAGFYDIVLTASVAHTWMLSDIFKGWL